MKYDLIPFSMLKKFTNEHPGIWERCDDVVSQKNKALPDWDARCDIPIAATICFDGPGSYPTPQLTAALYSWRKYKQVYCFDSDFAEELQSQPLDNAIPIDVLYAMPYNCIWIQDAQGDKGFFAWFEWSSRAEEIELCMLFADRNGEVKNIIPLHLIPGGTISDGIQAYLQQSAEILAEENITLPNDCAENLALLKHRQILAAKRALNLILYICSVNAEIEENKAQKTITRRTAESEKHPKDQYKEVRRWDVGYYIGRAIRRISAEKSKDDTRKHNGGGAHTPKRPHIRRGHYHSYWVGPREERALVLKWVAPTYINGDVDDTIPTAHNVKEDERFNDFKMLYSEAKEYNNFEMYLMERGWQSWMESYCTEDDYNANMLVDIMAFIYKASNGGIKELCDAAGIKMIQLSHIANIPYRTIQRWASGESEYPEHVKLLVSYAIFSNLFN